MTRPRKRSVRKPSSRISPEIYGEILLYKDFSMVSIIAAKQSVFLYRKEIQPVIDYLTQVAKYLRAKERGKR